MARVTPKATGCFCVEATFCRCLWARAANASAASSGAAYTTKHQLAPLQFGVRGDGQLSVKAPGEPRGGGTLPRGRSVGICREILSRADNFPASLHAGQLAPLRAGFCPSASQQELLMTTPSDFPGREPLADTDRATNSARRSFLSGTAATVAGSLVAGCASPQAAPSAAAVAARSTFDPATFTGPGIESETGTANPAVAVGPGQHGRRVAPDPEHRARAPATAGAGAGGLSVDRTRRVGHDEAGAAGLYSDPQHGRD